jgi:hypothetical protein
MATVGVKVLNKTGNRKVGDVAVTMVSQKTCYAASGPQGIHTARLNKARASATELARAEAHGIAQLDGTKPMRLHVVGDCSTKTAARTVSKAADAYSAKRGQKVFTYTHAWRNVPREAWGQVSVLASCETPEQIEEARRRGYATAIVVPEFPSEKAYTLKGEKVVPCPEQTGRSETCTSCRLCWDDVGLRERKVTIAFSAHGSAARRVKEAINKEACA